MDKKFIRGMTVREIRGRNSIPLVNDYNVYCNLQFVGVLRCPATQLLLLLYDKCQFMSILLYVIIMVAYSKSGIPNRRGKILDYRSTNTCWFSQNLNSWWKIDSIKLY